MSAIARSLATGSGASARSATSTSTRLSMRFALKGSSVVALSGRSGVSRPARMARSMSRTVRHSISCVSEGATASHMIARSASRDMVSGANSSFSTRVGSKPSPPYANSSTMFCAFRTVLS